MKFIVLLFSFLWSLCVHTLAQDNAAAGKGITLLQAIRQADSSYPLLRAKLYEAAAAQKNIRLSKNAMIPSLDITYQANLATYNNITGMYSPTGIMPISGPPSASNNYDPVFGSAAGLLLNWQPITFGQRNAQVQVSQAAAATKKAEADNAVFQHEINVASTYLDALLAAELVNVYEQNLERTVFNGKQSRVVTLAGLRPGVDTALFQSEISKARIDLLNARQHLHEQQVILSELLATDITLTPTDTLFFDKLPLPVVTTGSTVHPQLLLSQSQLDYSRSQRTLLNKSWLPKLNVWGTGYARGSGIYPDGRVKSTDGLGFSRYNYGAGIQLAFPILQFANVRVQKQQQDLLTRSNEALLQQTTLQLNKQQVLADTTLQNALAIAGETPAQYGAASYALKALQIRYKTGLVNFADLAQAQYSMVKAATDLKKSYWAAWKALLYKTAVTGDLNIFLTELP